MTTLSKSLEKHFAAIALAAVAGAGIAQCADAAIVHSGPVNIAIPDTIDGLYINVVTGVSSTTLPPPAGYDINPYSAVAGQLNLWGPTVNTWFNPQGVIGGNYNLPAGTMIQGAAAAFFRPGGGTNVAPNFTLNSNQNLVGFMFANEANANLIHFGWARLSFGATAGVRSITEYAYENVANTAIAAGAGGAPVNPCAQPLPLCAADVAPVGGNLLVNVDDLLAVINTWGQTQVPPGTGPRPQGDCAPLPNGNCVVNVDDLLAVINAWGSCPVPSGRCCAVNGTCSIQTAANCATAGGNYGGDGTSCVAFTCPVLPANDNCGGAIVVTNGQTAIDNTLATDSTAPGGACIFGGAINVKKDLWYTYTATCTGRITVDLCATGGTVTDTTIQLYTGTCAALVEVACDDDSCDPLTLTSTIADFDVTAGQQFRIRVGTWAASPAGPMILSIGCVVPSDDLCGDATAIGALPATINGTLVGATADGAPACNGVGAGVGRWYTVSSVTAQTLTASICDSPLAFWDGAISVYCGSSCDNLFCVAADAGDFCNFNPAPVSWCAAAGQTYWILVHSVSGPVLSDGAYELDVTAGAVCVPTVVCGSSNDECSGATVVNLGANSGDNALATTSAGIPGGACTFGGVANFTRDVWFRHTPAATGTLTVATCASAGPVTDSVISVFSGTCGALTEIGCIDDGCGTGGLLGSTTVPVTSGVQIFIRVGSWQASPAGAFTLTLSVPAPPCVVTCPGGAQVEGEPCQSALGDTTNAGCNATPPAFTPIIVGQPMCGISSAFTTGRDTDWYTFNVPATATYRIEITAEFTALVGFVAQPCPQAAFIAGSTLVTTAAQACTPVTSPAVSLTGPGTYVCFVSTSVFTGFPCGGANDYVVRVLTP